MEIADAIKETKDLTIFLEHSIKEFEKRTGLHVGDIHILRPRHQIGDIPQTPIVKLQLTLI